MSMIPRITTLRIATCLFVVALSNSAGAQGFGVPLDPTQDSANLTLGVGSVESGATTALPILAEPFGDPAAGIFEFGLIECTAGEMTILDLRPGASLQAFVAAGNSVPTCDITVDDVANTATYVMFVPGFDVTVWGSEFFLLDVEVLGAAGTTTTVTIDAFSSAIDYSLDITSPEVEFRRGDTDEDGQCTIADVVVMADILFRSRPTSCPDVVDFNDNGSLELLDMIEMLDSMFGSGPTFVMQCQVDAVADALPPCAGASVCP